MKFTSRTTLLVFLGLLGLRTPAQAESAVHVADPSLPGYTIFQPAALAHVTQRNALPIVGWVNGGCALHSAHYAAFLSEIASQGFLIIAIGDLKGPSADSAPRTAAALPGKLAGLPPPQTTTAALLHIADWATHQNGDPTSPYYGHLKPNAFAVMGHSCGGMQALEASLDPRVSTTVVLSSGLWRQGGTIPGITLSRETLRRLHAPVIYLFGGPSDVVYPNAIGDFDDIAVPIVEAYQNVGHNLSFAEAHGGAYARVAASWLAWQLRGDDAAAPLFRGTPCGLCSDPQWHVREKAID